MACGVYDLFVEGGGGGGGVSNYSVSVYSSPLQIPVLELEDGEGMCRLELGGERGREGGCGGRAPTLPVPLPLW